MNPSTNASEQKPALHIDELALNKIVEIEQNLDKVNRLKIIESWLVVLKQIITAADMYSIKNADDNNSNSQKALDRSNTNNNATHQNQLNIDVESDEGIYAGCDDDFEQIYTNANLFDQLSKNSVKWTIRVRAFRLVSRLVAVIESKNRTLLRQLPDLVRISFVAASSPYDDLKLEGFSMFLFLVNRFAYVEEREFPGRSIFEQYRTQVMTALKPAFEPEAPPYITAISVQIVSSWILHSLDRNISDFKRTFALMLASIVKLESQSTNKNIKLFNEFEIEQERLSILGSWAAVFLHSCDTCKQESICFFGELKTMIHHNIKSIVHYWWEALRDYGLLICSGPKRMVFQKLKNDIYGTTTVYTRETALILFEPVWHNITLATTMHLPKLIKQGKTEDQHVNYNKKKKNVKDSSDNNCHSNSTLQSNLELIRDKLQVKFICGILMNELFSINLLEKKLPESLHSVLKTLHFISSDSELKSILAEDVLIIREVLSLLYRMLLSDPCSLKTEDVKLIIETVECMHAIIIEGRLEECHLFPNVLCLLESLNQFLDNSKNAVDENDNFNLESQNATEKIFALKLGCLMKVAITYKEEIAQNQDIRDCLFMFLQKCILFEKNYSINTATLNHLEKLYTSLTSSFSSIYINTLFKFKVKFVSKLIQDTISNCFDDRENSSGAALNAIETYLKAIRHIMKLVPENKREGILAIYVRVLLSCSLDKINYKSSNKTLEDLLEISIRYIKELGTEHQALFKALLMDENIKSLVINTLKIHKELNDAKADFARANSRNDESKMISANSPCKIKLRMEFSNYCKQE